MRLRATELAGAAETAATHEGERRDSQGNSGSTTSSRATVQKQASRQTKWRFELPFVSEVKRVRANVRSRPFRSTLDRLLQCTQKPPGKRSLSELAEATALLAHMLPFIGAQDLTVQRMVATCCWAERRHAGDTICQQGEPGEVFYLNVYGNLQVFVSDTELKQQQHVATIKRGSAFGELALLSDQPRSTTVCASTDVVLIGIAKDDFIRIFHGQYAALGGEVTHFLKQHIRSLAEVSADSLRHILSAVGMDSYQQNYTIYPDSLRRVLLVKEGNVLLYASKAAGGYHIATLGAGELIGASALFPELQDGHVVKVGSKSVECFSIPVDIFQQSLPTWVWENLRSELTFRTEYLKRRKVPRESMWSYKPSADVDSPDESTTGYGQVIEDMRVANSSIRSYDPYEHHLLRQPHRPPSKLLQKLRQGASLEDADEDEGILRASEVEQSFQPISAKDTYQSGMNGAALLSRHRRKVY